MAWLATCITSKNTLQQGCMKGTFMISGGESHGMKSSSSIHHSVLAPTWTAFSDYTGPDLLCSTIFHF